MDCWEEMVLERPPYYEIVRLSDPSPGTVSFVGNIFFIFMFLIVYGIILYYENFSLVGALGVTRRSFFLHSILNNVIVVVICALIKILLFKIDSLILSKLGYDTMTNYGFFNLNNNVLLNIVILSFFFLVCASLGNLARIVIGFFTNLGYLSGLLAILLSYGIGYLAIRRVDIK